MARSDLLFKNIQEEGNNNFRDRRGNSKDKKVYDGGHKNVAGMRM